MRSGLEDEPIGSIELLVFSRLTSSKRKPPCAQCDSATSGGRYRTAPADSRWEWDSRSRSTWLQANATSARKVIADRINAPARRSSTARTNPTSHNAKHAAAASGAARGALTAQAEIERANAASAKGSIEIRWLAPQCGQMFARRLTLSPQSMQPFSRRLLGDADAPAVRLDVGRGTGVGVRLV